MKRIADVVVAVTIAVQKVWQLNLASIKKALATSQPIFNLKSLIISSYLPNTAREEFFFCFREVKLKLADLLLSQSSS